MPLEFIEGITNAEMKGKKNCNLTTVGPAGRDHQGDVSDEPPLEPPRPCSSPTVLLGSGGGMSAACHSVVFIYCIQQFK